MDVVRVYVRLQVVFQVHVLYITVLPERQTQMSRSAQVLDYLPRRLNICTPRGSCENLTTARTALAILGLV